MLKLQKSSIVVGILLTIAWTAKADVPASHFEPQVAMLCPSKGDQTYHSQYMLESGHWTTDLNHKVSCYRDKLDILEYCKKIYPKHDIRNIVESSNYVKISNWCKVGHAKCKHTDWVKPYRCLEGPFQSDALLVPEHCVFDHIHNQSKCWEYERWNQTAAQSCSERDLSLRSFAMLLPCGISLFAGVEFVCCPMKDKLQTKEAILSPLALNKFGQYSGAEDLEDLDDEDDSNDEDDAEEMKKPKDNKLPDDDDVDDDEDDDDDDDDDEADDSSYDSYENIVSPSSSPQSSTTTPTPTVPTKSHTTTRVPTPDPYFTHFEPKDEHHAFKEALQRLEEMHREKVTKVMKDWSDLEERYQDMRTKAPGVAEDFKQKMTLRFQQTVQSLEEEGNAEKHQLIAMHQQRVAARINQHKKDAMSCYIQALNDVSPNTHKVQKCLQKLLRALHKDRHHTIAHYKHLLSTNLDLATKERPMTLEHLVDIDHTINQSLTMLQRHPSLNAKIAELMADYMQALRSKDETPGSLMSLTREAEEAILDKYKAQVVAMQEDKERERFLEKQRKEVHKAEREELRAEKARAKAAIEAEGRNSDSVATNIPPAIPAIDLAVPAKPEAHGLSHHEMIQPAYAMTHDLSIGEPSYRRHDVTHGPMTSDNKGVYVTVVFAGVAVMAAVFIAMTVLKRRSARSPQNLGFIEVDQAATPEERHVANMQINGYENPTYKYFEIKE